MIDLQDPEERLATAGEYVLGTLDDADRDAFVEAMQDDRGLQADVYRWQDRLLGLSARAAAVEPTATLWQRLGQSLDAMSTPSSTPRREPLATRSPWWRRAAPWQAVSALAVAASVAMSVLLVRQFAAPAPADRYVALLQSPQDRSTGWVVEIEAGRKVRLVPVAASTAPPAGRSLQFWTKPQGAAGPTSLGLVRAGATLELPVSRLPGVGSQQLFEITLEPENGSPIGRPTGPILYVGSTVHL